MRIAVLVLGLLLGLLMFFQTFLVYSLSGATSQKETTEAGAVGLFMALLWLLACALVIPIPLVSTVVFVIAGLLGFAAASSSDFSDLSIWGVASLILAALSFVGWIGKRRGERKAEQRHQELLSAARGGSLPSLSIAQPLMASPAASNSAPGSGGVVQSHSSGGKFCTVCGTLNPPLAKFCANCGTAQTRP